MKKLAAFVCAALLAVTLAACSAGKKDASAQLRLFAGSCSQWLVADGNLYNYAVTDLDLDGRLELLVTTCQGSGLYTHTDVWQINSDFDGIEKCASSVAEGDTESDVAVDSAPVYRLSKGEPVYYIFGDVTRNGAAEYRESIRSFSLDEGTVKDAVLARKSTVYEGDTPVVTFSDADGAEITETQYNGAAAAAFAGCEQAQACFSWLTSDELSGCSSDELVTLLGTSLSGFDSGFSD